MKTIEEQDHYQVLEVPYSARLEDIKRAYPMIRAAYEDGSLATYSLFDSGESASIRDRIDLAYRVLTDVEARRAYDAELGLDAFDFESGGAVAADVEPTPHAAAASGAGIDVRPAIDALDELAETEDARGRDWDGTRLRGARGRFAARRGGAVPDVPGLAGTPYWTSRDVFEMESLPASIVIVGGGYVGCELAQFFHGVGVETTVVQRGDGLLQAEDEDVRRVFTEAFTARVPTRLATDLLRVEHDGARFAVDVRSADGEATLRAERLLLATGRVPNTHAIGIETSGVELDPDGHVRVDAHLRTTADRVWALGDVASGPQFTHTAAWAARYLERVLLDGESAPLDYGPVPHAVFSRPEVAGVGETEQALRARGAAYHAASLPYTTAAKGRAVKEEHGLCKVLVGADGALLGVHIVGHDASVLIHQAIMAMRWKPHIDALTEVMYIHPALPEVLRNTARKAASLLAG